LFTFNHEILTDARSVLKQIIPSFALGHDHAAPADFQNVNLMHILRKGDSLRQADGLAAITDEHRGGGHDVSLCISNWDIHSLAIIFFKDRLPGRLASLVPSLVPRPGVLGPKMLVAYGERYGHSEIRIVPSPVTSSDRAPLSVAEIGRPAAPTRRRGQAHP